MRVNATLVSLAAPVEGEVRTAVASQRVASARMAASKPRTSTPAAVEAR
jgi:hypothetical protein